MSQYLCLLRQVLRSLPYNRHGRSEPRGPQLAHKAGNRHGERPLGWDTVSSPKPSSSVAAPRSCPSCMSFSITEVETSSMKLPQQCHHVANLRLPGCLQSGANHLGIVSSKEIAILRRKYLPRNQLFTGRIPVPRLQRLNMPGPDWPGWSQQLVVMA